MLLLCCEALSPDSAQDVIQYIECRRHILANVLESVQECLAVVVLTKRGHLSVDICQHLLYLLQLHTCLGLIEL